MVERWSKSMSEATTIRPTTNILAKEYLRRLVSQRCAAILTWGGGTLSSGVLPNAFVLLSFLKSIGPCLIRNFRARIIYYGTQIFKSISEKRPEKLFPIVQHLDLSVS